MASENRKGNRLFAQGKYDDAEKAYLDAEINHPGTPEILYNLGNSLIKQKKYEKGIQTIRQSINKGNGDLKENSWYNAGNAFFLMGDYKDSSEAFIHALQLNPADKDAKHNLELALMRWKQQRESKPNQNSGKLENPKQDQRSTNKQMQPQAGNQGNSGDGVQKEKGQKDADVRQSTLSPRREGAITKDQALQILDALKDQEIQDRRMLFEHRAGRQPEERDW